MYDFILQTVLVGSLAVMAFLLARALPRVEPEENPRRFFARLCNWLDSLPLHHLDERLNALLFKFLKRTRVVVMKIDNRLIRHLDRVKKSGEQAAPSDHVQELIDHMQKGDREKEGEALL